ncbi:hypothetical protein ACP70R_027042 [Stipagrostis hirtigluma subsp. patula]
MPARTHSRATGGASSIVAETTDMDMWASSPPELLLEIFRRLGATGVVRCAGVCKPWRRAIIGNAACLRPRPDRFLPDLLLGFVYRVWYLQNDARLHPSPGPFASTLTVASAATDTSCYAADATVSSFVQTVEAAGGGGAAVKLSNGPLSSRDGLLLLRGSKAAHGLCLYNPMTGACTFLAAAALEAWTYVLVTGYDLSPSDGDGHDPALAVHIFAVTMEEAETGMAFRYQVFTTSSAGGGTGTWGPVKRSPVKLRKGLKVEMSHGREVICQGAIHWLCYSAASRRHTCTIAVDVHTGRSWTTELPKQWRHWNNYYETNLLALATSMDGRLSVVRPKRRNQIEVWVLVGADQWTLWQTTAMDPNINLVKLCSFCPRSGCVLEESDRKLICINVERGSLPPVKCIDNVFGYCHCPYEMDWSTYISRMKHF